MYETTRARTRPPTRRDPIELRAAVPDVDGEAGVVEREEVRVPNADLERAKKNDLLLERLCILGKECKTLVN
jgi:hypothetical protein